MKGCSKNTKIITTLVILTLLFLCAVNITYSYFSATTKVTSSVNLPEFSLSCAYSTELSDDSTAVNSTQLEIYPNATQIKRGTVFNLQVLDETSELVAVDNIGCVVNGVRSAYVRFWIDAYVVSDGVVNTSVNYGEYFLVGFNEGGFVEVQDLYSQFFSKENSTYFIIEPLSGSLDCFNLIQLSASAPAAILGETLRVLVTFQGVQIENGAYKSVFDDERGYCSDWGV